MRNAVFSDYAQEQYSKLAKSGNATMKNKLDRLIVACCIDPFNGLGRPHSITAPHSTIKAENNSDIASEKMYSRRINGKDRLIYSVTDTLIIIHQCMGHYADR